MSLLVAARAGDRIDKVVLYEPPVGTPTSGGEWLDELEAMVATGDLDAAVKVFAAAANVTDREQQTMESNDRVWGRLRDGVRSAGREIRAAKAVLPLDRDILASITVPTLLLLGAEQEHAAYSGVRGLADELRFGRLEHVPGHHLALVFAPDAFVAAVRPFLAATADRVRGTETPSCASEIGCLASGPHAEGGRPLRAALAWGGARGRDGADGHRRSVISARSAGAAPRPTGSPRGT